MLRYLTASLCLGLCVAGSLFAEEIRGKFKGVSADKTRMTLIVGDNKERTLELNKDVKVFGTFTPKFRRPVTMEISNGLASIQPNADVIAVTENREKRDQVTQIRIQGNQPASTRILPLPK